MAGRRAMGEKEGEWSGGRGRREEEREGADNFLGD